VSEHRAAVEWTRSTPGFGYDEFNRSHLVRFGEHEAPGDTIADFFGRGEGADPEALFAASLAACHMLTFLAVASRQRIVVDSYADEPAAFLEKNAAGRLALARVVLKPRVRFAAEVAPAKLAQLHALAHRNCFVAHAVKAEVVIEPQDAPA